MRTHQQIQEELNRHIEHLPHSWYGSQANCRAQQSVLRDARFETEEEVRQDMADLEREMKLKPDWEPFKAQLRIYKWILQTPRKQQTAESNPEPAPKEESER